MLLILVEVIPINIERYLTSVEMPPGISESFK
jgi:hypothetical protein